MDRGEVAWLPTLKGTTPFRGPQKQFSLSGPTACTGIFRRPAWAPATAPHLLDNEATPSLADVRGSMIVLGWLVALHRAEPLPGPHQGHCDHPGWLVAPHILKASRPEKGSNFHPLMPPLFLSFLSAWLLKKIKHGWFHLGRISIPGRAGGCDRNGKSGGTELPGKGRGAAVPGGGPGVGTEGSSPPRSHGGPSMP